MLDQSRFSTGPPATPHHAQTMARALPGKAKAGWSAKSRRLWRQSPTMFGHHLRLLCTVCWVVDANHSQRPRQPLPKALGLPTVEAGDAIHSQWRWAFPPWPVGDAQGPHCERRHKAKMSHSANSGLACPWTAMGSSHTDGCYFEMILCREVIMTTMLEHASAPHLHGTDSRNIHRPA